MTRRRAGAETDERDASGEQPRADRDERLHDVPADREVLQPQRPAVQRDATLAGRCAHRWSPYAGRAPRRSRWRRAPAGDGMNRSSSWGRASDQTERTAATPRARSHAGRPGDRTRWIGHSSDVVLGNGMATQGFDASEIDPAAHGVGYLLADGGTPRRIKAAYLSDQEIAVIVRAGQHLRSLPFTPPAPTSGSVGGFR